MADVECPYCNAELEICHDDGFGYTEDVAHEMRCWKCDKNFVFRTSISFYYHPSKADCLNGEPHDLIVSDQTSYRREHCRDCDYDKYEWKPISHGDNTGS